MNREAAEKIADAVLYEGYMLYPYRPSAIKNRQRWTFGTIYPPAYEEVGRGTERSYMRSECLLVAGERTTVRAKMRFLQLLTRQLANSAGEAVSSLSIDGRMLESWDEGVQRHVEIEMLQLHGLCSEFSFAEDVTSELLRDSQDQQMGSVSRRKYEINGSIACSAERVHNNVYKLAIEITNDTLLTGNVADRNEALLRSFLSAHTILSVEGGEFASLLDPPNELRDATAACKNVGNFPVLLGDEGAHDMMLCSPIVLYDHPKIAPESAGDFFDGTEMDEMLTLRVMTLTDEEKNEMRTADDRVRSLLQRTEETAREQLMRTHGVIRSMRPVDEK